MMTPENIAELLTDAKNNLSGEYVWQYVNSTTNLKDILANKENDPTVAITMAAFFSGMKFSLENLEEETESKPFYTIPETAELLKVHENTIYKMVRAGKIEHYKIGKQIRIAAAELEKLKVERKA